MMCGSLVGDSFFVLNNQPTLRIGLSHQQLPAVAIFGVRPTGDKELAATKRGDPQRAVEIKSFSLLEVVVRLEKHARLAVAAEPPVPICERRRLDSEVRVAALENML